MTLGPVENIKTGMENDTVGRVEVEEGSVEEEPRVLMLVQRAVASCSDHCATDLVVLVAISETVAPSRLFVAKLVKLYLGDSAFSRGFLSEPHRHSQFEQPVAE